MIRSRMIILKYLMIYDMDQAAVVSFTVVCGSSTFESGISISVWLVKRNG